MSTRNVRLNFKFDSDSSCSGHHNRILSEKKAHRSNPHTCGEKHRSLGTNERVVKSITHVSLINPKWFFSPNDFRFA